MEPLHNKMVKPSEVARIISGNKLVPLKELFNAKELRRYDAADGTIMHVEVQIDDSVIMLGDSSEEFPPNNLLIHVYVLDEVFNKAIELGCISLEVPREREGDPDRRGTFKDFAGNIWSIATQL